MAFTSISLLLRRHKPFQSPKLFLPFRLSSRLIASYSTASSSPEPGINSGISQDPKKPLNLSARLSFVFDQIDAIEKERSQKDETLQRIRSWRQSKNHPDSTQGDPLDSTRNDSVGGGSSQSNSDGLNQKVGGEVVARKEVEVELVHPWPEWIELMERLVQQNFFDHKRKDEDKMSEDLGFDMMEVVEDLGFDFTRDWKTVQTACLNFGKDRFDILRSLSRQDIQVLVGYGCPSADKKVAFSAKLLRKHVHLEEGDVCSSCSLRSSCEKAYLLTNKEDEARTIDIMRVLLTYGFDPINGSVVNKSLLKLKNVKTVVRKLLHEIVKLSAVPIDPNLPPPIFKKPPPKVKQPPPPPKKRVGRDDIEMKKGDWLCTKCDFMNFAKNTVCLQCDAKRPKRQLLPGEWECPECNFLNYRRNMACFHCECKRPRDEYMDNQVEERQRDPRMMMRKVPSREEVSNAWNFDFDDDESDGADVAAFEYADSARTGDNFPPDVRAQTGHAKSPEDNFNGESKAQDTNRRENSARDTDRMGFDDFDDEEDDIDSYEIDTRNNIPDQRPSLDRYPNFRGLSDSEDLDDLNNERRVSSSSYGKTRRQRGAAFSGSEDNDLDFDSDKDLPVHPNWKSSHVANVRQGRVRNGPSRGLSFGSDDEYELSSGADDDLDNDFGSKRVRGDSGDFSRHSSRNRGSDSEDGIYGSETGDDQWHKPRSGPRTENRAGSTRGGNNFRGRSQIEFARGSRNEFRDSRSDYRGSRNEFRDSRNQFRDRNSGRGRGNGFRSQDDYGNRGNGFGSQDDYGNRGNGFRSQDDYGNSRDSRNAFRGSKSGRGRGGQSFRGRSEFDSFKEHFSNNERSSQRPRGNNRGIREDEYRGRKPNERNGPRQERFGNQRRGGFSRNDRFDRDNDFEDGRPRRQRIIER